MLVKILFLHFFPKPFEVRSSLDDQLESSLIFLCLLNCRGTFLRKLSKYNTPMNEENIILCSLVNLNYYFKVKLLCAQIREYHRRHPAARVVDVNEEDGLLKEEPQIEFSGEVSLFLLLPWICIELLDFSSFMVKPVFSWNWSTASLQAMYGNMLQVQSWKQTSCLHFHVFMVS